MGVESRKTMNQLLLWYNLIFYIPIAISLIAVIGVGFSGVGHEVGIHGDIHGGFHADADQDADGDHDGESQNQPSWLISFLGFGRVPVAISFMTLLILFGGTGVCVNTLLSPLINIWNGFAWISVGAACIVMFFGTAFVSRTVARLMPTTETDSVKKMDLIGCSGEITLKCDKLCGLAQIKNRKGDLYQINCRSDEPLSKGTKILTFEYDEAFDTYKVVVDPLTGG